MVLFKKKTKPGEHEIVREGQEEILHINYDSYPRIPSIEDDAIVMASVIEKLSQSPAVSRIIFHQKKKYEYSYQQTMLLLEISQIYSYFMRQKKILAQAALEVFDPFTLVFIRFAIATISLLYFVRKDLHRKAFKELFPVALIGSLCHRRYVGSRWCASGIKKIT